MLQRILLPLVCLLAGIAIGFWAGRPSPVTVPSATTGAANAKVLRATSQPLSAIPKTTEVPKPRQQQAALDELVDDFSAKRGKRLADSMTLDEITAGLAYLASKPKDASARAMRLELMRAWAQRDPNAAWKAALAMPPSADRAIFLGAVAGQLASTQPDAALMLATSLGNPAERTSALRTLFQDWAKINAIAAMNYWNAHPDISGDGFTLSSMISAASVKDPATATRLALSMQAPSDYSDGGLSLALGKWLETDPASARRWLDGITDPVQRDRALKAFATSSTHNDPQAVLKLVAGIASSETRLEAQRSILSNWVRSDPAKAANYLATLDREGLDSSMAIYISSAVGELNAKEQSHFLAQLPQGMLKTGIIAGIVRKATSSGRYVQAVEAVNLMDDSPDRERSLHSLAVSWGKTDPKSLTAWMNQQADSSDRDLVMAGYTASLAFTDPHGALKLAGSIPDKSVQKTAMQNILSRWMSADQVAAKAWMNASTLFSASEKDMILRMASFSTSIPMTPRVQQPR